MDQMSRSRVTGLTGSSALAVEPHTLGRSLFLHLAPGVANLTATVLGLATLWNPTLPPSLFFGVLTNVFVLIPIQLGYLYYLAKKNSNSGWSLEGIVILGRSIGWSRYCIWVPAILLPTALVFLLFQPLTEWLKVFIGFDVIGGAHANVTSPLAEIVLIANILLTGVLVPITEELYFRGYLLPRMPKQFGRLKPVAHSFLFSVYHFDSPWMIPVRTFGLLPLIFTTLHTRSVRPGIIAHCLVNLANFAEVISSRVRS